MSATKKVHEPRTNTLEIVLNFGDVANGDGLIVERRVEFNSLTTAAELTKRLLESDACIINSGVLEHTGRDHGTIEINGQIVAVWRDNQIDGELTGTISYIGHRISSAKKEDDRNNWKPLFDRHDAA